MSKVNSLILIIQLFTLSAFAVNHDIQLNYGYGQTKIDVPNRNIEIPFNFDNDSYQYDFTSFGLNYLISPDSITYWLKSGINYCTRSNNENEFNYINIPLGLDFAFGKKLRFIVGFGLQYNFLTSYNVSPEFSDFEENHKSFQIGANGNIGLEYQFCPKYRISLVYQKNTDVINMYQEDRNSPGGNEYSISYKGYDRFLKIGLTYSF